MSGVVRRLVAADAEAYVAIRRAMLIAEPLSFLAAPGNDRGCDLEEQRRQLALAGPDHALFGAFMGNGGGGAQRLVGAVGAIRPTNHVKALHKVHIWGMYVAPDARGRGLGRGLMEAAIAHASTIPEVTHIELGVTEVGAAALALYESVGFESYGRDPAALCVDGRLVADTKMLLRLP